MSCNEDCGLKSSDEGEPNASKGARSVRRGGWLATGIQQWMNRAPSLLYLRYCGHLPKGANYLGTIRSQEDVEEARKIPGSFAVQDGNGEWMLFRISLGRA